MSLKKLPLLLVFILAQSVLGQNAKIYEEKRVMKTYPFSDPNPVPDMEMNYPYFRYDGFTNKSRQQEWNMVVLENDYIKVFVNTDVGGKIWGAIEKSTGQEFLYFNEVVKFRDVAQRGPWTSGGLEFNFGFIGHTSTSATPQDYVIKNNADGSVSCIIGAIDLHTHAQWNVEIKLEKDKAYVETISSCFNTGNLPEPYYHYSNAAAKADGDLEFIFPGDHYVGHEQIVSTWPEEDGREISFYKNNDFGGPKSYHIVNSIAEYMGGYYHEDDYGFGNLHDFRAMPGKKLWIWGLSDEGMIWEGLLTDSDGQYIEYQTGATFNQAMEASSLTPFKHREIIPYDSDISSEVYFPLKQTGGMVMANRNAVLNVLEVDKSTIEIRLSPLAPLQGDLVVKSESETVATQTLSLKPLELYSTKVNVGEGKEYRIQIGKNILSYSSETGDEIVDRPVLPNTEFDWDSAIGWFTKGFEIEKQYGYTVSGRARKMAQVYYLKALELDPAYAPALRRAAFNYYRMMQYDEALSLINKALAIDTYDPEANYLFGLLNVKLNKKANAKSGFSIAAQSTSFRTAAHTELTKLYLKENDLDAALEEVENALDYNRKNLVAQELKVLIFRLKNDKEQAEDALRELYKLDNTNAFVAHEAKLLGSDGYIELNKLITNELQSESYIELALKYHAVGQNEESIEVLKQSPADAKVLLLLAYLDVANRENWLQKALKASPNLVFPFRTEMYEALTELTALSDDWKLNYYKALILWKKELLEEAKALMQQCGDRPDYAPFYLAKAKLFANEGTLVDQALEKAKQLAPKDWRVQLALVDQLIGKQQYSEAAKIAKKVYDSNLDNSVMGIRYASALLKSGKYKQALSFLEQLVIIPFEGAFEGRAIYHEAAIRLAYESIHKGNYAGAVTYVEKAKLWPKNLGTGLPYNVDERLENSILAHCYGKMGKTELAAQRYQEIVDYGLDNDDPENANLYLQILALQRTDAAGKIPSRIEEALKRDPNNSYVLWVKAMYEGGPSAGQLTEKLQEENQQNPLNNTFLLVKDFLDITPSSNP
ncbi:DUF5107 domain-containing protein [Flagellimonas amoyensis]|uniref:DUF5107 domain-containing protein n=1 Tax=Flagellimonas amoyensis TaxID=2169401 RepID=UPI000D381D8A|nr:DUF5107 domain-containing protein [Allomuricauda amoyensis]